MLLIALTFFAPEPPDLVLSGEELPPGAVARFGIPHKTFPNPYYPFTAGYSDEGSFRVAVAEGKDVRVWTWHAPGAQPPKHLFRGHPADVTRVVLSADGRTLAAGDKGHDLRVWDLATGDELLALSDEPSEGVLAVGPRGRFILRAGKNTSAVWETTTKKRLAVVDKREFKAAAFSPDGKVLVTADAKGKLELWEPRTLKRVGELAWEPPPAPKDQGPFGLKLGPGGKPIVPPPGKGGLYHVVDPPSPEHDGGVVRIAFSADGSRLITAGASVVRLWDTGTKEELWRASHSRYHTNVGNATAWTYDSGKLTGADISADGTLVATADISGRVRLLDAATGKEVWRTGEICGDLYRSPVLGVAFHPNGKWLATNSAGACVDLWDLRTGARLATTGGDIGGGAGLAFSPDGKYLAGLGAHRFLDVYDLTAKRPVARARVHGSGAGMGFTPDGKYIVTGPGYYTSAAVAEFRREARLPFRALHPSDWHISAGAVCIDPRAPSRVVAAGNRSIVYGENFLTRKWHTYGDGTEKTFITVSDAPNHVALAPDVNRIVVGSGRYGAQGLVYDLKTGTQPVKLEGTGPAYGVAVTRDGKLIAATSRIAHGGSNPQQLRVWDGETGKLKFKTEFGDKHGSPPEFSLDGKRVAIGSGDEIVLVDVATGKEEARLTAHHGIVWRVVFSADGKRMASCGGDGQTLVWDTGAVLRAKP